VPASGDAVIGTPPRDPVADGGHATGEFLARDSRIVDAIRAREHRSVTATEPTGLDLDEHRLPARCRPFAFADLEGARLRDDCTTHQCSSPCPPYRSVVVRDGSTQVLTAPNVIAVP